MPKSPTTTRAILSPRLGNPYTRNSNVPVKAVDYANLDIGSPKDILDPDPARKHNEVAVFDPDSIAEGCASLSTSTPVAVPPNAVPRPMRKLAVASSRVNESAYWNLTGDFMRDGIHVYSKSGKHVIEDPLAYDNAKQPRWLQVQFNVVILEESYWNCEIVLKDMGNLPCGKDVLIAVQSGGVSVDLKKGKYTIFLKPNPDDEDPRIAISYFIPYAEKHYLQAMDGELPYGFLLQRVVGAAEQKAKKKRTSRWRQKRAKFIQAVTAPLL